MHCCSMLKTCYWKIVGWPKTSNGHFYYHFIDIKHSSRDLFIRSAFSEYINSKFRSIISRIRSSTWLRNLIFCFTRNHDYVVTWDNLLFLKEEKKEWVISGSKFTIIFYHLGGIQKIAISLKYMTKKISSRESLKMTCYFLIIQSKELMTRLLIIF